MGGVSGCMQSKCMGVIQKSFNAGPLAEDDSSAALVSSDSTMAAPAPAADDAGKEPEYTSGLKCLNVPSDMQSCLEANDDDNSKELLTCGVCNKCFKESTVKPTEEQCKTYEGVGVLSGIPEQFRHFADGDDKKDDKAVESTAADS